jgi:signal transduction histidine kinase
MPVFTDLSIRHKMTAIILGISFAVLLLASAVFVIIEVATSRRAVVQELSVIAEIVGSNSTAALAFRDDVSAQETLSALKAKPNIVLAYIYTSDGGVFARYPADAGDMNPPLPPFGEEAGGDFNTPAGDAGANDLLSHMFDEYLELRKPILLDGVEIGQVYLRSNLNDLFSRLNLYLSVSGAVLLLSVVIALLLSSRLQRVISGPILRLADTMKTVSNEEDYAIRANKHGNDELGSLIDGFNSMLVQIQARDEGLRAARRQAETANRAKTEFLANVSHELRTPLNAILGFSQIMKGELLGPLGNAQYRAYADDICESGTHLLQVINDILDISKVEVGRLELREEDVRVGRVVEQSVRLVGERAQDAGLRVTVDVDPNLPGLYADERLVKQCLINLLSNAVKFTAKGGEITMRGFLEPDGPLAIAVADTGIGIAEEDIPRVLAPFNQVDASLSRKYEGTGLGLPLVNSFVQMHGGSLGIKSELGVGVAEGTPSDAGPTGGDPPSAAGEQRLARPFRDQSSTH